MQSGYAVHTWKVDDLSLCARDYPARADADTLPILCLHGLTRNAKDFDRLARRLAARGHRVVVPDMRGRGRSDYDPDPTRYVPRTYVVDVIALLDGLGIGRAIFIGTSMGGIITMGVAAARPALVAAAVLNDVGPEVAPEGLARIASYAGRPVTINSWDDARAHLRRFNDAVFPQFDDEAWMAFARQTFREGADGTPQLDYDPAIAVPIQAGRLKANPTSAWLLFDTLCRNRPVLLLRGMLSDIVSNDILARMQARAPSLAVAQVPAVGHAPLLDEPESLAALDHFLQHVHDTRGTA